MQKQALRKATRQILRQLSDVEQQSYAITTRLLALPAFHTSASISCYLSMPTAEARTPVIVDAVLKSGKTLFVPKIKGDIMDCLRVYSTYDLASLPSGTWGIKEPGETHQGETRASALSEHLDMIVLPGVAFDRALLRLGHGKGYYDRFIASYVASGRKKPLLVGICLREQLLPTGQSVPHESHDWPLDILITPDEVLERGNEEGNAAP